MFSLPFLALVAVTLIQEPATAQQPTVAVPNTNALMIVCDAEPSKFILLDSEGKWISSVREAKLNYTLQSPPTVDCVMYEGSFKPKNPKTKTWTIVELKSVSSEDFFGYIDALQDDPLAIKKMATKK